MKQHFQPISAFKKEPYKKILCFPKVKETEVEKRLKELKKLGITHVSFSCPLQIEKKNKFFLRLCQGMETVKSLKVFLVLD